MAFNKIFRCIMFLFFTCGSVFLSTKSLQSDENSYNYNSIENYSCYSQDKKNVFFNLNKFSVVFDSSKPNYYEVDVPINILRPMNGGKPVFGLNVILGNSSNAVNNYISTDSSHFQNNTFKIFVEKTVFLNSDVQTSDLYFNFNLFLTDFNPETGKQEDYFNCYEKLTLNMSTLLNLPTFLDSGFAAYKINIPKNITFDEGKISKIESGNVNISENLDTSSFVLSRLFNFTSNVSDVTYSGEIQVLNSSFYNFSKPIQIQFTNKSNITESAIVANTFFNIDKNLVTDKLDGDATVATKGIILPITVDSKVTFISEIEVSSLINFPIAIKTTVNPSETLSSLKYKAKHQNNVNNFNYDKHFHIEL